MIKRNEGFTLIELLVTISAGALVTFAAISLLLLGARVQYNTTQESSEQQTVRVAMSLLEKMAGSGAFNTIETTYDGWKLLSVTENGFGEKNETPVFEYVNAEQTIYRGQKSDNEPVLTGLNNAGVAMEGNLLRLSFETTRGGSYVTRVYCRTARIEDTQEEIQTDEAVKDFFKGETSLGGRLAFLDILAGEYNDGNNTGMSPSTGEYYSHWYIGNDGWGKNGWNKDTPWCACFVSWAAEQNGISGFRFADVDVGMELFRQAGKDAEPNNGKWVDAGTGTMPTPGDYIFFDWSGEQKDPAHVGVVLDTRDGYVYTIEGNSSGRVAVRKYSITDPVIMGYGVLTGFEIA